MPRLLRVARLASLLATSGLRAATPEPPPDFRAAVEAVQNAAHRHADGSASYFTELEQGFRRLQARFPNEPEVYAELLFIADHRDGPGGPDLARQILKWPSPPLVREKAEGVLWKRSAIGKSCRLEWDTLDGRRFRVPDQLGKVVLIDFWATWCPPCREKLPELLDLHRRHQASGFEIIGISFDEDPAKLRRFVEEHRIPWPQSTDGKGWTESPRARTSGLTSLPAMWLVDRQGRLREVDARANLATKLEGLLAESK